MTDKTAAVERVMETLGAYPSLALVSRNTLSVWPEHADFLLKTFVPRSVEEMADSETLGALIVRIAEFHETPLAEIASDYKYFCQEMILEEELYFRRHGRYRLSTFEEAYREVYSNDGMMKRYMNGLLLSSIFWLNHAKALSFYVRTYLSGNVDGYDHLEVGPGHGTLLFFAANDPRVGSVTGWDVSPGSVKATRRTLSAFDLDGKVNVECQDVFESAKGQHAFDSVVVSEVLEHLEDPARALDNLIQCMTPGGRILVNMPANSPSPDHLYLLREPEEAIHLVEAAGFEVVDSKLFPMTGYSLEKARKMDLTINCSVIGRKPAS